MSHSTPTPKRRMSRRLALRSAALACGALLLGAALPDGQAAARKGRHVVLISLDGFGAYNLDDARLPLPNIRRLAREGVRADAMTVSTPSVTWPNHTTLVTGVEPARHGVMANGRIEASMGPAPLAINPVRSKEELCRVPTLYDLAHGQGLRTAEVNWPVTRGAPTLHWSFPDHPQSVTHTTPALVKKLGEWGLLSEPTNEAFTRLGAAGRDYVWAQTAVRLIREEKPNLLLLHLLATDSTQHAHGPQTPEAFAALALADRYVGDVLQAVDDARLRDRTSVFVAADHGFVGTTRSINPNVRFREAELIRTAGGARLEYDIQSISEGGVALVYVPGGRNRAEVVRKAREALTGLEGVARILGPAEYGPFGIPTPERSSQGPDLVLAAQDGYAFGNAVTGDAVTALAKPGGTHGYLQTNPKVDALFVAGGAGLKRGARVARVRNIDVAPTIARLLGVTMQDVDGRPLEEILQSGK